MLRNSTACAMKFDFSSRLFLFPSSHNGWFQYSLRISSHDLLPGGIQFDKVLPVLSVIYLAVCLSVDLCIDPKIKTYTGCLILWNFLQLSSICCKYCTNFDCARKAGKCREAIKRHRILLGNDSLLSKNASCSYIFGFRKLASIFLKSFTFWTFVSCSMK